MPVKEKSFRIGCGRYIQEKGAIKYLGGEVLRYGKYPLVIGDDTSISITKDLICKSFADAEIEYEIIIHNGTCNDERATELAELCKSKGFDVVVGVGGGVICDFAKLCGYFAKIPTINVPTSSATCAAYTPLSVRYSPEGRTVGSLHYDYEVNAVIADTEIIAKQPVRLLLAGVFDALAKFVEIKQRFCEDSEEACPLGLDYAYYLSKQSYKLLTEKTATCIEDMAKGEVTDTVENIIFTTIAVTGVISGIARGSNQCALGHKFYEITRKLFPDASMPYLHGEIVGVGLILQNHFNGEQENNVHLIELMNKNNMPSTVGEIAVSCDDVTFEKYYELLCNSSAIDKNNNDECTKLRLSLRYLWNL